MFKANRSFWLAALVGAAFLVPATALALTASSQEGNLTQACPCGAVSGKVGAIIPFSTTTTYTGFFQAEQVTVGAVGAMWLGKQPTVCGHPQRTPMNYVEHIYDATISLGEEAYVLGVRQASTAFASGGAPQLVGGTPWWWDTVGGASETRAQVQYFDFGTNSWQPHSGTYLVLSDTQGHANVSDDPGNNTGATSTWTSGTGGDGDTEYYTAVLDARFRVRVEYNCHGGPTSGDNCDVDELAGLVAGLYTIVVGVH